MLIAVSLLIIAILNLRNGQLTWTRNQALGEYVGLRWKVHKETQGTFEAPLPASAWGGSKYGEFYAAYVKDLVKAGRYRFFVYEDGALHRFIVIDQTPEVCADGIIPKDLMILSGPR